MQQKPLVTISLLTWNGARYLPWLIRSIKEQYFKEWELLILDNASSDDSVSTVKEYYPQGRIILQKNNIGFCRGHNMLMNWSSAKYILVINQDIILEKDFLQTLVDFMEKNPKAGSASGKLLYWDFTNNKKSKIIDSLGLKIDHKRSVSDIEQGQQDHPVETHQVFGLSGACVLYRRQALEAVSELMSDNHYEFFDEAFFAYKEDIDLAWRLRLAGWQNWLVGTTKAYHHRSLKSTQSLKERRKVRGAANRLSYRNHLMVLYKNSFRLNLWKDLVEIKIYEIKKFFYLLLFERSTLDGLSEYIRSKPALRKKRKFVRKITAVKAEDMYHWFD